LYSSKRYPAGVGEDLDAALAAGIVGAKVRERYSLRRPVDLQIGHADPVDDRSRGAHEAGIRRSLPGVLQRDLREPVQRDFQSLRDDDRVRVAVRVPELMLRSVVHLPLVDLPFCRVVPHLVRECASPRRRRWRLALSRYWGPIGASAYFHVPFGLRITLLPSCVTARIFANAPVGLRPGRPGRWPTFSQGAWGVLLSDAAVRPETETLGEEALDVLGGDLLGDVGWELLENFLASPAMPTTCSQRDVMYVSLPSMKRSAWRTRSARAGGVEGAPRATSRSGRTDPPTGSRACP